MNTTNTTAAQVEAQNYLLEYSELARRAYMGTSFDPDKRAKNIIEECNNLLLDDLAMIAAATEETKSQYIQRFKKFFAAWMHAKSRCMSSMITGPANFPVERMRKYNNWERNASDKFQEFREKAIKGILKGLEPEKTFMSELERYTAELEAMKANHEKMKEANKKIKDALKNGADISEWLMREMSVPPHMIEWTLRWGFGLQNNLANIKRVEQRIELMKAKQQNAENIGEQTRQFEGFKVILNHEADRIQIQHDVKPDAETISQLKKHGFKWSPKFAAWQRQLNMNGIRAAERVLNIQLIK